MSALDTVTLCPICTTEFEDAQILPCHHPLCKPCIIRLTKRSHVECPTCRRSCDIINIMADFRLAQFKEALKEVEEELNDKVEPSLSGSSGSRSIILSSNRKTSTSSMEERKKKVHFEEMKTKPRSHSFSSHPHKTITEQSCFLDLASGTWVEEKQLALPKFSHSIRIIRETLWVCHSRGLTVYDDTLRLRWTIDIPADFHVWDVAPVNIDGEQQIVVAAQNGLTYRTKKGKLLRRIATGCFTAVVAHENVVFAAHIPSRTVRCYAYSKRKGWCKATEFSLNCNNKNKDSCHVTLGVTNDNLYVCHFFCGIQVYTFSGKLQRTLQGLSKKNLELQHPCLHCTDSSGHLLITELSSNRLQVLNNKGEWAGVHLEPPPKFPSSAQLYKQQLFVAHGYGETNNEYTISVYKNTTRQSSMCTIS